MPRLLRASWVASLLVVVVCGRGLAQERRPLTIADADHWPSLRSVTPSPNGKWVAYAIATHAGDGVLEVRSVAGTTVHRCPRGEAPSFTADSRWVVFRIAPAKAEQRRGKIAKLREAIAAGKNEVPEDKPGDEPKPGLGILDLLTKRVEVVDGVDSFQLTQRGAWLAYRLARPAAGDRAAEAGGERGEGRAQRRSGGSRAARATGGEPPAEDGDGQWKRRDGTTLVLRDLARGVEDGVDFVLGHRFVADRFLVYDVQTKDDGEREKRGDAGAAQDAPRPALGLFARELATGKTTTLLRGPADYASFALDKAERRLAFLSNLGDTEAAQPAVALYLWELDDRPARRLVDAKTAGMLPMTRVARAEPSFSRDGSVLLFGAEEVPPPPLAPVLPEDKVTLDLWHWRDPSIQPMQAKRRDRDSIPCVYRLEERRVVALWPQGGSTARLITADGSRALLSDSRPYEPLVAFDGRYADHYVVDTSDGARDRLLTKLRGQVVPSLRGRYLLYLGADGHWHAIDLDARIDRCLTAGLSVAFAREDDDTPDPAPAYGVAGWTEGDAAVVLYDRFDLWQVDLGTGAALCITDGRGRAERTVLRYVPLEDESEAEPAAPAPTAPPAQPTSPGEPLAPAAPVAARRPDERPMPARILLSAFDERDKSAGYWTDSMVAVAQPLELVERAARFEGLQRARRADRLFFTLSSFEAFPDLWTSGLDFRDMRRLTDANPLQREVAWGTVELVEWRSADGIPLQGRLIKPDGFDPRRRYPMLVHFYERMSQNLHRYSAPQPGTSPNPALYVSHGYLWFEPDIVYRQGYPGQSALNCVVPGVQALVARGYADPGAIGIAGHSWGGYQVAYLITATTMFAAAEAGAPVSNMISAYGGIRWGTGMSRQFQYEQTQSRIGGTPWQYPLRFIENSPIFFADKVSTPLLMLHNDNDGAVPWNQGVEYFMALRRLDKECYLFNYVGEDHGLRKRQNQRDWSRRMLEFFDHHLRGAPAPAWMREGVRYRDRDREKVQSAPSYIEATAVPLPEVSGAGGQGGSGG
jgi:dienelactone hydrolase